MQLEGSCHCGKVRFSVHASQPYPFNLCYCSICRKTDGGGGFAINLGADNETLQVQGEEHISVYRADVLDGDSGGMKKRVGLARALVLNPKVVFFDEPTTGLHFEDIRVLMEVLEKLVEKGNTVLVIEHNMDVIKLADYIFDIGYEGGKKGGELVAKGTPEQIIKDKKSYTAQFLKKELN